MTTEQPPREIIVATLTDGRTMRAEITMGDLARLEIESGERATELLERQRIASAAKLAFFAASRTHQFAGTFDEWLIALANAETIEDTQPVPVGAHDGNTNH